MANYPIINAKARPPRGKSERGAGPRKGTLGGYHIPSPTNTHTHKDTHVVTHMAPYVWIPVRSGENDLQAWPCQVGDVERASVHSGLWVEPKVGGEQPALSLLVGSLAGAPLAIFLGRALHTTPLSSSHLLVALPSTTGRNQSWGIPAVQTSAWAVKSANLRLLVSLY